MYDNSRTVPAYCDAPPIFSMIYSPRTSKYRAVRLCQFSSTFVLLVLQIKAQKVCVRLKPSLLHASHAVCTPRVRTCGVLVWFSYLAALPRLLQPNVGLGILRLAVRRRVLVRQLHRRIRSVAAIKCLLSSSHACVPYSSASYSKHWL